VNAIDLGFCQQWGLMAYAIHHNAVQHGWWETERNQYELLALVHAEISEAVEALRKHNPESTKIPGYSLVEEEVADAIIRLMDQAYANGWNVAGAILAKHAYNINRPHRHGGLDA
jgi:hypothetical protein